MSSDKEEKFARFIAVLGTAFEKGGLSKGKVEVYFHYLQDLTEGQLKRAVDKIILSRRYQSMPTIAEIRQAAFDLLEEDVEVEALEAWPRACKDLDTVQGGGKPKDLVAAEAVRIAFGGWKAFGETETTYEARDRARFIEAYKIAAARMVGEREMMKELEENRKMLEALKPKRLEGAK
jgi:hypothetical protein